MTHHPFRFLLAALLLAPLAAGCDQKKASSTAGRETPAGPARDGEAAALATLEGHPDTEAIRTALQRLDGLESVAARPSWADADRAEIVGLCRLTDAEAADLGRRTFSVADANYVEECLTIRAALRALNLDRRPPLDRGTIAFDWVCRTAFVDARIPAPAPPWATLEGGYGIALSRAYAVLAAWRQVGLDGCLVGPPALKDAPGFAPNTLRPAPVRACGLKIGPDVLLFDPAAGRAVPGADGKGVLTLAAARATPAAAKGLADEGEVKTWQPFLAPPLNALTKRMEWLEGYNPGTAGVKLFTDVRTEINRFKEGGGETPGVWNPPGDGFCLGRIVAQYTTEQSPDGGPPMSLRELHRKWLVPFELLPPNKIEGSAQALVQDAFRRWYDRFWFTAGSPRDLYVRGNLPDALSALDEIGREISTLKTRVAQDKGLRADFTNYFNTLFQMSADRERAKGNPEKFAEAHQRFMDYAAQAKNRDIERAYTLGTAARPMMAEVLYLTAACVHERAERTQLDGGADAVAGWRNAAGCWDRYLADAAATRKAFAGREAHARALRARCQSFLPR